MSRGCRFRAPGVAPQRPEGELEASGAGAEREAASGWRRRQRGGV